MATPSAFVSFEADLSEKNLLPWDLERMDPEPAMAAAWSPMLAEQPKAFEEVSLNTACLRRQKSQAIVQFFRKRRPLTENGPVGRNDTQLDISSLLFGPEPMRPNQ